MKAYIDTSVLTAAYCAEPGSRKAEQALQGCVPVISSLTRLEFSSSVAKKLRIKSLVPKEAVAIISQFHAHLRQGVFEFIQLAPEDYAQANDWLDTLQTPLRSLDALHLAAAFSRKNMLLTSDRNMAEAAGRFGVKFRLI